MEAAPVGTYKCKLPECSIESNGKCVNGLTPAGCPNKIEVATIHEVQATPEPLKKTTVKLPWGDAFTDENLASITYRDFVKLIVVAGEPSSGKSTIYAAIFDSFHKGGCGEYLFAGTRTPIAFEEICHLAREKSKGRKPSNERTKAYEFNYLHLAVKKKDGSGNKEHVVLADINGEVFQHAKDSDEETKRLKILKRASHLFFIADGALLLDEGLRHVAKNDVFNLISRCLQNDMLPDKIRVNIVVTKWDEICEANKEQAVRDFFITPAKAKFANCIEDIIPIASRSMNPDVPSRFGIDKFLGICLEDVESKPSETFTPSITRQFQRFKYELSSK